MEWDKQKVGRSLRPNYEKAPIYEIGQNIAKLFSQISGSLVP